MTTRVIFKSVSMSLIYFLIHIFNVLLTPRCWLVKRSIVLTVRRDFGGERHFQDCHLNLIKSLLDGEVQRSFTDRQELECDQNQKL